MTPLFTPLQRLLAKPRAGLSLAKGNAALAFTPILAQLEEEEPERAYSLEVALVMLCVILGLMVTLKASKRTEVDEKPRD